MRRINHSFDFTSSEDLIRKYIDVYSCLAATDDQWLTRREKDLFVQYVLFVNRGEDLSSTKVQAELCIKANMERKNKSLYIYRSKLAAKGWVTGTPKNIQIPSMFKFKDGNIPSIGVNFQLLLDEER